MREITLPYAERLSEPPSEIQQPAIQATPSVHCTMKNPKKFPITLGRCLPLAGTLLAASLPAHAEIIGSFVLNGDGTVTYFYQVDNRGGLFDVAQWSLEFDLAAPDWNPLDVASGGSVSVPDPIWVAGPGIPVLGQSAQDFLSLDPTGDVLVGDILGGFSFTSTYLPGVVTYYEFSALGDSVSGTTIGPVPVIPEAGGWAWGLAATTGIAFATVLRRSRSTRPAQDLQA